MRVRRPNFLSDVHTGAKGNAAAGDHRNQKQSRYPVFPRKDQGEGAGTPRIFCEVHLLPRRAEGESPHMGGAEVRLYRHQLHPAIWICCMLFTARMYYAGSNAHGSVSRRCAMSAMLKNGLNFRATGILTVDFTA
jgi:hypothetical protein